MEIVDPVSKLLEQKSPEVISIRSDESVFSAIKLLAEKRIGAVLVIDDGKLVGILSERDYARKVILKGRSSKDTLIREIMTPSPITISPDASVDDAMHVMTSNKFRHLPIADSEGRVLGVLSIGDLVKWIVSSKDEAIKHLERYITGGQAAGAASGA
ncbi:MAG: CBS domain-containing protein [Acidobacteriaceae bacterium]|nr:CBS domain-containing protein [Acidobacteriaceae bacterium]MBV9781032.1 CBS domain-containing protein [Acidobacteriaceae bacterium]